MPEDTACNPVPVQALFCAGFFAAADDLVAVPIQIGIGVSGDAAANRISTATQAFVSDGQEVTAGGVSLTATDSTLLGAATGATVLAGHTGLAGSFAWNDLQQDTRAYTDDASVNSGGLIVDADSFLFCRH